MPAWYGDGYYKYGQKYAATDPRGYALVGIKVELAYNGMAKGLVLDIPYFGDAMRNRVKEFQASVGLIADGVVGPRTMRRLFLKRIVDIEAAEKLPALLLQKKTQGESNWDIAAYNNNIKDGVLLSTDRGLNQINNKMQTAVNDEEAYTPTFSLPWAANHLSENIVMVGSVKGGLAAYNIGVFYAKKWHNAGFPASGMLTEKGFDYAAAATRYVNYIMGQELV